MKSNRAIPTCAHNIPSMFFCVRPPDQCKLGLELELTSARRSEGSYFTPQDLSAIALSLDALEEGVRDVPAEAGAHSISRGVTQSTSTNMDDSGFFSVQVLDQALQVWGLKYAHRWAVRFSPITDQSFPSLESWRSENMRPFAEMPHTQHAFIFNYMSHWFTIRRFGGPSGSDTLDAPSNSDALGHWFNLNSFLEKPEYVGRLYLAMLIQQAEREGYSVFTVISNDRNQRSVLPATEADAVANTLPEPGPMASEWEKIGRLETTQSDSITGFEDEDLELQAALQASLEGNEVGESSTPMPVGRTSATRHSGRESTSSRSRSRRIKAETNDVLIDPVARSIARNAAMLKRMQQEQEFALRDSYEQEISGASGSRSHNDTEEHDMRTLQAQIHQTPSTFDTNRVYDDDDAELQAALRASLEDDGSTVWNTPVLNPGTQLVVPGPPASTSSQPPMLRATSVSTDGEVNNDNENENANDDEDDHHPPATPVPLTPAMDHDAIRRMRLAKFGR